MDAIDVSDSLVEMGRSAHELGEEFMRTDKGFSLIELLIVVAIILIIVAIAIPNLLRARMAANESSAASGVRTINSAQVTYRSTYPTTGYATALSDLGGTAAQCATPGPTNACLVDEIIAQNGQPAGSGKSGYMYSGAGGGTVAGVNMNYYAAARPMSVNYTGARTFCSDEDSVVRVEPTGALVGSHAACMALGPLQ